MLSYWATHAHPAYTCYPHVQAFEVTVVGGNERADDRWAESAKETAGLDVDNVYLRFPGIKVMLQWLEAARLVQRMAQQVKVDEASRESLLKQVACTAMQSGMRGRQSRVAFQALLSKARGNMEERNKNAPPPVEVRVEAAPPAAIPRRANASVW